MIHQGHKYTHKGETVIALESTQDTRALVKVLRGPFDTGWASPYYAWASELVPLGMAYFGGEIPGANVPMSRARDTTAEARDAVAPRLDGRVKPL